MEQQLDHLNYLFCTERDIDEILSELTRLKEEYKSYKNLRITCIDDEGIFLIGDNESYFT